MLVSKKAMIKFMVYGQPIPKARARTVLRGGKVMTFTPAKTRSWETLVALEANRYVHKLLEGPVALTVNFFLVKPRSTKRKWPTVRPDLDNLLKSVKDALCGRVFRDDAQVVRCEMGKYYTCELPRVEIEVRNIT